MNFLQFLALFYLVAAVECCVENPELSFRRSFRGLHRRVNSTATATIPIGTGDRFNGGNIAPQGLGSRPDGSTYNLGSIMNVKEIESALKGLAKEYGMEIITAPDQTYNGATMLGGKVGDKNCPEAYRVYFTAGIHARERGGPDNLIYFISDLLFAKASNTGLTYGGRSYSNADVLKALSTGIVFLPLTNPDGVDWDQTTDSCWRKNRNPASAIPGNDDSIGVDLNRNFDFLWDFPVYFTPQAALADSLASNDPQIETFHGKSEFSEPETNNIAWVMDQFPRIRWYMDIHSYSGVILYNWGDDDNQASIPSQNFRNPAYDGKRGDLSDIYAIYKEWIDPADWNNLQLVAGRTALAMGSAAARPYSAHQSVGLYPTSGASDDYAFSRFQTDPSRNKIYGFTMEFGFANLASSCSFYPTSDQFHKSVLETGAGFMEFLLAAADAGLGDPVSCPPDGDCFGTCKPGDICGFRSTCEVFNPDPPTPNFGKSFCFCQAGYKATGIADDDIHNQYHITWKNNLGDQTHRVAVKPGQDCGSLCGDVNCSEVLYKNECR